MQAVVVAPGTALAVELHGDWAREKTITDVIKIVLTERRLGA